MVDMEVTLKINESDSEMVEMHTRHYSTHYLMGVVHIDCFFGSDFHDRLMDGETITVELVERGS